MKSKKELEGVEIGKVIPVVRSSIHQSNWYENFSDREELSFVITS